MKSISLFDLLQKKARRKTKQVTFTEDELLVEQILNLIKERSGKRSEKVQQIIDMIRDKHHIINISSKSNQNKKVNIAYYSLRYLPDLFEYFIDNNYNINYQFISKTSKKTLLLGLCDSKAKHSLKVIKTVCKKCEDLINFTDRKGRTAIIHALINEKIEVADILVKNKNIELSNKSTKKLIANAISDKEVKKLSFFLNNTIPLNFINEISFSSYYHGDKNINLLELIDKIDYTNDLKKSEQFISLCLNLLKNKGFDFEKGIQNTTLRHLIIKNGFTFEHLNYMLDEKQLINILEKDPLDAFFLASDLVYQSKSLIDVNKLHLLNVNHDGLTIVDIIAHCFLNQYSYYEKKKYYELTNNHSFLDCLDLLHKKNINSNKDISKYQYYSFSYHSYFTDDNLKEIKIKDNNDTYAYTHQHNNFLYLILQHFSSLFKESKLNINDKEKLKNKLYTYLEYELLHTNVTRQHYLITPIISIYADDPVKTTNLIKKIIDKAATINKNIFDLMNRVTTENTGEQIKKYYFQKDNLNIFNYIKESFDSIPDKETRKEILQLMPLLNIENIQTINNGIFEKAKEFYYSDDTAIFFEQCESIISDKIIEHEKIILSESIPAKIHSTKFNRI